MTRRVLVSGEVYAQQWGEELELAKARGDEEQEAFARRMIRFNLEVAQKQRASAVKSVSGQEEPNG